ncbi:MAG: Rrf2 family transcriptional regulator [Alphaproteobacteria bacterium]
MLTMKCKYALKAMVVLAAEGKKLSSRAIAEKARVPVKFLEAILTELKQEGLIKTERGAQGGHMLNATPAKVMAGQVVRAIDGMLAPIPCASTFYYKKCDDCEHEEVCVIRQAMLEVRNNISTVLDGLSLKDLIDMSPKQRQKIFW